MSTPAALVDALYAAFDTPRPTDIEGCPCCVTDAHRAQLLARPRRSATADDLGRYAFKAMSTWGTGEHYRYFAPRILELVFSRPAWAGFDLELVTGKLLSAGWRNWSTAEHDAVRAWLAHHWWIAIESGRPGEELLDALSMLGHDIAGCLARWQAHLDDRGPLLALAEALLDDWNRLGERSPSRLVGWMLGAERRAALMAGFEAHIEDDAADLIAEAIDAWDWAAGVRRRMLEHGRQR